MTRTVSPPQVFFAITRQVLQTKKETTKDSPAKDTIKVGKGGGGGAKKKSSKCC